MGICQNITNKKRTTKSTINNKKIPENYNNINDNSYNINIDNFDPLFFSNNYNNNDYNNNSNNDYNNYSNNDYNNNSNNDYNNYSNNDYNNYSNNDNNYSNNYDFNIENENNENNENIKLLQERREKKINELLENNNDILKDIQSNNELKNDINNELKKSIIKLEKYYNTMIKARKIYEKKNKEIENNKKGLNNTNNNISNSIYESVNLPTYEEVHNKKEYDLAGSNELPNYNEVHGINDSIKDKGMVEINEYTKFIRYKEKDNAKFKQRECIICLREFKNGETLLILECEHLYHENCLKDWINKIRDIFCPLCQTLLE